MSDPDTTAVDAILAEVADTQPTVPDALMAAVLRDAAFVQPRGAVVAEQPGIWATLLDLIGGWPAVSGLAAAGMAGVWLGFAPPVALQVATVSLLGQLQAVDLLGSDTLSAFLIEDDM